MDNDTIKLYGILLKLVICIANVNVNSLAEHIKVYDKNTIYAYTSSKQKPRERDIDEKGNGDVFYRPAAIIEYLNENIAKCDEEAKRDIISAIRYFFSCIDHSIIKGKIPSWADNTEKINEIIQASFTFAYDNNVPVDLNIDELKRFNVHVDDNRFRYIRNDHSSEEKHISKLENVRQLKDFLYVDHDRLSSYIEQINGPEILEEVSDWDAALSEAEPQINTSQKTILHENAVYEKVDMLTEYLLKHGLAVSGVERYFKESSCRQIFVYDTLQLSKVWIPDISDSEWKSPNLVMWLWSGESSITSYKNTSFICLMEGSRRPDARFIYPSSCFSILTTMLHLAAKRVRDDILNGLPFAKYYKEKENWLEIEGSFIEDPYSTLSRLGFFVSEKRTITTLFRIREVCSYWESASIFGYPIFLYV